MMAIKLETVDLNSIWIPAQEDSETPYLMVVLHGRGDSGEGFVWLPEELKIPRMNYLLLNAPDPYYGGFSWYDLPPDQLPGILRSRSLLEKVFLELFSKGFAPERCFLFGFSQGCLMTVEFGMRFSAVLAGYLAISGYVYDPERVIQEADPQAKKGNWLIIHGTSDDVLPVEKTRAQIQQLIQHGFNIEYAEFPKSHTLDQVKELPFIRSWVEQIVLKKS